jgi:ABC-2 type transport system permease protein
MSAAVLIKAETIKLAKLRGFWLILISYVLFLLVLMDSATEARPGRPPITFPEVWPSMLNFLAPVTLMLCVSLVVIMVATEFTWRTARQNVIDGLSKTEWYFGKLLMLLLVTVLFIIIGLLTTVSYALIIGIEINGQLIRASDWRMIGAFVLCLAGYLSFGFFLSMTVRNPGAVALFLGAYVMFVELMIVEVMKLKGWTTAAKFFLRSVFGELLQAHRWDVAAQEQMRRLNRVPEIPWTNDQVVGLSVLYIVLILGATYVIHQKRDL